VSFLSALGGGHQAAFMFDPADRAANDTGAAIRESERRARASEAQRTSVLPTRFSRARGVSTSEAQPVARVEVGRDRAQSTPQQVAQP